MSLPSLVSVLAYCRLLSISNNLLCVSASLWLVIFHSVLFYDHQQRGVVLKDLNIKDAASENNNELHSNS